LVDADKDKKNKKKDEGLNLDNLIFKGGDKGKLLTTGQEIMDGFQQGMRQTETITFYIKTIQFFDAKGEKINEPILVEQVFGSFDEYRLYDTSILHY